MIGINRRRVQALSVLQFQTELVKWHAQWATLGYPDEDQMPRVLLATKIALREECERRGQQLRLWSDD